MDSLVRTLTEVLKLTAHDSLISRHTVLACAKDQVFHIVNCLDPLLNRVILMILESLGSDAKVFHACSRVLDHDVVVLVIHPLPDPESLERMS